MNTSSYPNVLHIWNTANIASELAYFMGDGHQVIARRKIDHYRMAEICKNVTETNFPFGPNKLDIMWFYLMVCKRRFGADILHVHGSNIIQHLRRIVSTPYILHYHGVDCRNSSPASRAPLEEGAKAIIVATPDLLRCECAKKPHYLPNIINTELFAPRDIPSDNRGLINLTPNQDIQETMSRLSEYGFGDVEWDIVQREYDTTKAQHRVMYQDMPDKLSQYEYYSGLAWDGVTGIWYQADTKTALEAMSLGVKVVRHDGSMSSSLPARHHPENVIPKLRAIYDSVI